MPRRHTFSRIAVSYTHLVLKVAEQREANEEVLLQRILKGETTTFEMFRANYEKLNLNEEADVK